MFDEVYRAVLKKKKNGKNKYIWLYKSERNYKGPIRVSAGISNKWEKRKDEYAGNTNLKLKTE